MKRLSKHILSLLRRYDSVVLPGIGVYRLSYVPAELNREDSAIAPPHFEVTFREGAAMPPELVEEGFGASVADNRLLDSYIRKMQSSPEEARAEMKKDLDEFANYLSFGGNPLFADLKLLNPPLPEIPVRLIAQRKQPEEELSSKEIFVEDAAGSRPATHVSWRNPDYYYIPVHKKLANIAACILLVVIVGIAAVMPIGTSGNPSSTAAIVPLPVSEQTEAVEAIDEPDSLTAVAAEEQLPDSVSTVSNVSENPALTEMPSDRYFAIVAAFSTEKEAHKFIDGEKGDKARFDIIKNSRFYMVSVSASAERAQLDSRMPLIRAQFPDAWIYTLPN